MDGRILLIIACDEWQNAVRACVCVCVCIVLSVKDWYVFTDGAKLVDTKIWTLISLMARPTKLGQIDFKMVTKYGTVDEIVG